MFDGLGKGDVPTHDATDVKRARPTTRPQHQSSVKEKIEEMLSCNRLDH